MSWRELIVEGRGPRLMLLCFGIWLTAADMLMTATIMPSVAGEIGGYAWLGWAIAGYVLGAIPGGASAGRMAGRFGLAGAFEISALVYAAGCGLSALAPNIELFLAGRVLQGVGGGWGTGLCYIAATRLFPEALWPRVFGTISGVWGVAALISPGIGGVFASIGFWRGAFWLFLAQSLGFALLARILMPRSLGSEAEPAPVRLNAAFGLLLLGIFAITAAGLSREGSWSALLGALGIGLLYVFLRLDARHRRSLLPREASDPLTAVGAGLLIPLTLGASTISFTAYGPLLMQTLYAASPLVSGYTLVIESLAWTAASIWVAGRAGRREAFFMQLGGILVFLGLVSMIWTVPHGPIAIIAASAAVQGAGFGLLWAFMTARVVKHVADDERDRAASAVPTAHMIGNASGSAAAGALANLIGLSEGGSRAVVEAAAFWLFAAFVPLALVGVWATFRTSRFSG